MKNNQKKISDRYSDKEAFAKNIMEYETSQLKKGIINIQLDLKSFENKYGLSSKELHRKFTSGEFGDDEDLFIWAGIYELLGQNERRLVELE